MRRPILLPGAFVLAALLGLLIAAPAGAATTGTICGQVTAFQAPALGVNGSITINGTTEVIDASAFGAIDAATLTTLTLLADADATTCLDVTADGAGAIVDLDVAAQARICGTAALDTTTGVHSVGGVALPTSLITAGGSLDALLDAAATANANVCADVTIDGTSGLITTVRLDATLTVCGDATLDADSAMMGGVDVPFTLLDAEAEAALQLAVDAGADVCLTLVVDDTSLVQANLSASIDLCGEVTLDASGNATVDGVVIDAALLDADAAALLALAASADGTACASVDVASSGGTTSVGVTVSIQVCAEVTAITDNTITLGGVTFVFAGAADADIQIGDELCVTAATGPTGEPIITDSDVAAGSGTGPATVGTTLPDTATDQPMSPIVLGGLLLGVAIGLAGAVGLERGRS